MPDNVTITESGGVINVAVQETSTEVITLQVPGLPGAAASLTIGSVTTLASGASATASITGTAPNFSLNLGLPQGAPGTGGSADATTTTKGSVQLAGDLGGTAALPTVVGGTHHTHTSSQISDSSTVGRSVLTAADAPTARTAIGAGTSSLTLGTTSTTALAGNYSPPAATTTAPGLVQLAGDLAGTSVAPTVPGLANKANSSITISAGTGLTGGGDLTAARTLAVAYGSAAGTAVQGNDTRVTADQAAATASIRTIGTGALQAAAGSHTHTSTGITDAASAATVSVIMKRDAAGRAQVVDPAVAADIATKNYVDTKAVKNTGPATIDDSAGAVTDNVLILKSPASFTGAFIKLNSGGTDYMTLTLSSTNEPIIYNPITNAVSSNNAVRIGNPNGSVRILPYNDGNVYVQSTLSGLQFTGLNGADGAGAVTFGYASAVFHGPVQVNGKVTSVTDPTAAQDAATKNYVDTTKVANAGGVSKIQVMTQAAYTALGTKDSATLYVIQG